jgi:hypothetical protein
VRSISTADLIFLIRHDKAKVSRLKTFLSWKDVRKNVKDSDEKGGGDAGEVDFDDVCYERIKYGGFVSELISIRVLTCQALDLWTPRKLRTRKPS